MNTNRVTVEDIHRISIKQIHDAALLLRGLIIPIEQQELLDDIRDARLSLMKIHHKLNYEMRGLDLGTEEQSGRFIQKRRQTIRQSPLLQRHCAS